MKKLIDRFLDWLKIKPKEEFKPIEFKAKPFPEETPKAKPAVKKATTRPAVKKATTVAKKTTKKAK
jgi:hypothetical protein